MPTCNERPVRVEPCGSTAVPRAAGIGAIEPSRMVALSAYCCPIWVIRRRQPNWLSWVDLTRSPKGIRTAGTLGQPPSDVAAAEPNRGRQSSGLGSYWSQLPGWGRSPAMVCSLNKAPTADRRRRVRCRDQSSSRSSGAQGAGHFPGTSGTGPHCGLAAEIRRLGNSEPHRSAPSDLG